ncbi:Bcr/CflA family multidrug efflux MFS transporter [Nocardioides mesophilus]|uniref:Bcr/CflA family multidrug efflux MFS transporter n=1 Tax=Nocardioides mesophilus TaxID=433659 RepID=A0A7G9R8M9_9ACTN|nr:Bcr/CflA family multidrug efflux MFS transporter [Nocardioides mesophilus]QNN51954.1 Bcr/CflA family multidrug efflux MFS transporter [Nocardioides mesophilus]
MTQLRTPEATTGDPTPTLAGAAAATEVAAAPDSRATAGGAPGRPEPLTRGRHVQLIVVLGLLIALGPLSIDMYLPAFPDIATDLSASTSAVQLTLTGMLAGLAVGQLVIGPLSDVFGRRRPLLAGLAVHLLASLLCAIAPTVAVLSVVRVLQGFAGAAISVVALATVRDLFTGSAVARTMSRLMLVIGLAPILAPTLGGFVLAVTDWRGIFVVLAGAALLLSAVAFFGLRETLPPERRSAPGVRSTLRTYRSLFRDRTFVALVLIGGLMFASIFAYVGSASFVLQDGYGLDERSFGLVFGLNSLALTVLSQLNPTLIGRFGTANVLTFAIFMSLAAALGVVVTGASGAGGLVGVLVPLGLVLGAAGLAMPNTPALALTRHGESAGTASALLGSVQFGIGAMVAPLVGLFGGTSAVPMGATMAGVTGLAALLMVLVVRRDPSVHHLD